MAEIGGAVSRWLKILNNLQHTHPLKPALLGSTTSAVVFYVYWSHMPL